MSTISAIIITAAVSALYIMALTANRRAERAEAALARVEAVIEDIDNAVRAHSNAHASGIAVIAALAEHNRATVKVF